MEIKKKVIYGTEICYVNYMFLTFERTPYNSLDKLLVLDFLEISKE
jgi:hypothetical protein